MSNHDEFDECEVAACIVWSPVCFVRLRQCYGSAVSLRIGTRHVAGLGFGFPVRGLLSTPRSKTGSLSLSPALSELHWVNFLGDTLRETGNGNGISLFLYICMYFDF